MLYKLALVLIIAEAGMDGRLLKGEGAENEVESHQIVISAASFQRSRPTSPTVLQDFHAGLSNVQVRSFRSRTEAIPTCIGFIPSHSVRAPPCS